MDKTFICHICGKQFTSITSLIRHFKIKNDEEHRQYRNKLNIMSQAYMLNLDLNVFKCTDNICSQCNKACCRWEKYVFNLLKEQQDILLQKQKEKEQLELIKKIKIQEQLKQKQLKLEELKQKQIKQEQLRHEKEQLRLKKQQEKERLRLEKEEQKRKRCLINIIKQNEKKMYLDIKNYIKNIAIKLVKEFYALCHLSYDNYIFDLAKIKNLLKIGYTAEEIRNTFGFMYGTGRYKLCYLQEYTIKDGKDWKNFQLQLRNPQSIPSLITKYYRVLNIKVANSLIFKNTQDFWSLQNEYKLTQEQIEYIFNYMIKKRIPVFNYIKAQIPLLLQEFNKSSMYIIDVQKYNSNEYYFESAINDLQEGTETLDNIINIYGPNDLFQKKIFSFLKNREYNKSFSAIEWLYKIQAPVTKEMYFLAKQITQEQKRALYHFNDDNEINNFKSWLRNYKNIYES